MHPGTTHTSPVTKPNTPTTPGHFPCRTVPCLSPLPSALTPHPGATVPVLGASTMKEKGNISSHSPLPPSPSPPISLVSSFCRNVTLPPALCPLLPQVGELNRVPFSGKAKSCGLRQPVSPEYARNDSKNEWRIASKRTGNKIIRPPMLPQGTQPCLITLSVPLDIYLSCCRLHCGTHHTTRHTQSRELTIEWTGPSNQTALWKIDTDIAPHDGGAPLDHPGPNRHWQRRQSIFIRGPTPITAAAADSWLILKMQRAITEINKTQFVKEHKSI